MATVDADLILERLDALDTRLVECGWPALSPFWREVFEKFVRGNRHERRALRRLVLRVGRRGGKSSSLCRFAVVWALYGAPPIPPGDIGYVTFVSTRREEASMRLFTIASILTAAGIAFDQDGDEIRLRGRNVGFKVLTGTVAGVSGWTSILIICDEVAKWLDRQTLQNPATEVLAALRPTGATTNAPEILSSSPVTDDDAHARAFDEGDTEHQIVAYAPTWLANPTLTEAQTHALEQDDRVWRREYCAIPQPGVLDGYLADVVGQCIDKYRTAGAPCPGVEYIIALDPAWRRDEFAVAIARAEPNRDGLPVVTIEEVTGWRGKPGEPLSVETTSERISELCRRWGTTRVYSDQKDVDTLSALLARWGIDLFGVPWTAQNKVGKFRAFRALCMDRRASLPNEPTTIKQLESICIKLTPSGGETFEGRGADDRAFAVVLAATEAADRCPPLHPIEAPGPGIGPSFDGMSLDFTSMGFDQRSTSQVIGEARAQGYTHQLQDFANSLLRGGR